MKIGVMVESFKSSSIDSIVESNNPMQAFTTGVKKASELGAAGIQAYATFGALRFDEMNKTKIKEVLDIVKSNGLIFSAICGDFGGHGFEDKAENESKVENSKRVLDLAKELECDIVTTHIGTVPGEECEKKDIMRKACRELAVYADSIGSAFAVETGPEPCVTLGAFLDSLGAMGVRVNFDPANLVMCVADDPVKGVETLSKYIVHTHAKDGIMIGDREGWEELPLGKGGVDFDNYLLALNKIGYTGFLTIEREVGDNPEADIKLAKDFLTEKLVKLGLNG
ncbi:MAG: sugar phosphate isomerase/epimerase [Oscillospiraceae bacterium]|nr:sugar phosphate isomerase/epimerase [Oscillospiraceae bacterium]